MSHVFLVLFTVYHLFCELFRWNEYHRSKVNVNATLICDYKRKIVNSSLLRDSFPSGLGRAIITPILKKASLDKNTLGNYRPVSNLPFVGKLIEKVVSAQVSDYISSNGFLIRTNLPTPKLVCRMTSSVRSITSKLSSYLC